MTQQVPSRLEDSCSCHLGEGHVLWSWLEVGPGLCHMLPESFSSDWHLELLLMVLGCQPHHWGGTRGHKEEGDRAGREQGGCLHSKELER